MHTTLLARQRALATGQIPKNSPTLPRESANSLYYQVSRLVPFAISTAELLLDGAYTGSANSLEFHYSDCSEVDESQCHQQVLGNEVSPLIMEVLQAARIHQSHG